MDILHRQITKIAREVNRFTVRMLKNQGVGTAEFDFIHAVRKHPGITQAGLRELLNLDKGAAARQAASLEAKGYLIRSENPADKRSRLLYATPKADALKNSKASVEALYYEWLTETLSPEEQAQLSYLMNLLYQKSKAESRSGFPHLAERFYRQEGDEHDKAPE